MIFNIYQIIILIIYFLIFFLFKKNQIWGNSFPFFSFHKEYTTTMRGIAILFVVLHHVGNSSGSVIFTPLGGIGVAMFLILSGYGLNESKKAGSNKNYWKNKIVRVIIPMLLVELISIVINKSDRLSYSEIFKHLLCIDRNWYVRYLFYWYFLFYILTKIFKKGYEYVLLCAGLIMLFLLPEIEAEQSLSFVTGVFLSIYKDKIKLSQRQVIITSGALLFVGGLFLIIKQIPEIRFYAGTTIYSTLQLFLKLTIANSVLFSCTILFRSKSPYFLYFTGLMSYEIYLVHCKLLGITSSSQTILSLLSFYVLTYIFSYVLYRVNQRITSILLKKKISEKK